jgi:hypothetical protein
MQLFNFPDLSPVPASLQKMIVENVQFPFHTYIENFPAIIPSPLSLPSSHHNHPLTRLLERFRTGESLIQMGFRKIRQNPPLEAQDVP